MEEYRSLHRRPAWIWTFHVWAPHPSSQRYELICSWAFVMTWHHGSTADRNHHWTTLHATYCMTSPPHRVRPKRLNLITWWSRQPNTPTFQVPIHKRIQKHIMHARRERTQITTNYRIRAFSRAWLEPVLSTSSQDFSNSWLLILLPHQWIPNAYIIIGNVFRRILYVCKNNAIV